VLGLAVFQSLDERIHATALEAARAAAPEILVRARLLLLGLQSVVLGGGHAVGHVLHRQAAAELGAPLCGKRRSERVVGRATQSD